MNDKKRVYQIGVVLVVLAILGGMAHGYYVASNVNPYRAHFSGDVLCNGIFVDDTIRVDSTDKIILLNHKVAIDRGNVSISLFDPSGNLVYQREDSSSIFRQHAVRILDESQIGIWTFSMICDRADIKYELSLEVNNL